MLNNFELFLVSPVKTFDNIIMALKLNINQRRVTLYLCVGVMKSIGSGDSARNAHLETASTTIFPRFRVKVIFGGCIEGIISNEYNTVNAVA